MTSFPQLSNFLFSPRRRRGLSRFGYFGAKRRGKVTSNASRVVHENRIHRNV